MSFLLDTCTFIWLILDRPELSKAARESIEDLGNETYLSAASSWEMTIKYGLGKLALPDHPTRYIPDRRAAHNIDELPLQEAAALATGRLPALHKDPFDRLLIAQAIENGLAILTPDENIRQYPVKTLW